MSDSIIGLQPGPTPPALAYLLDWERAAWARAVGDIFGYHALQLGMPHQDTLQANRMPHRWLVDQAFPKPVSPSNPSEPRSNHTPERRIALVADFAALPFASSSIDLVVLPHTLEYSTQPHATLREVERVLVPEGRVVLCGLNPWSLWGRQARGESTERWRMPWHGAADGNGAPAHVRGEAIGYRRLRDWLHLLGFEVEQSSFGCYRPPLASAAWLQRLAFMDRWGPRWWRVLGGVYCVVAVKRVRGIRLLPALGRKAKPARMSVPAALPQRQHRNAPLSHNAEESNTHG